MSENSQKKQHKKKRTLSDKSMLVEEIINKQKQFAKSKPEKKRKQVFDEKRLLKKARNEEETLPNSTMAFNNGLESVSTPMKKVDEIKDEPEDFAFVEDSVEQGKSAFRQVIFPIALDKFMKVHWEKKFLHVKRNDPKYYKHLMSVKSIDQMLRENHIQYTRNIDITSYINGQRVTKNPEGRAKSSEVWDFYEEGCSIRILNPQSYIDEVYKMNAQIQEYFHCMTGTNVYLTPPNSQGFAPHYDDIEAFVLQIEGKKHWRLYNPRCDEEVLPRESSQNFDQNEIGQPILDVVLEAGDMLYFPRGIIHQANTVPGCHSLHITLSVYQKQSYVDFFEYLLTGALQNAIETDVEFRKGVPLDFHKHLGVVYSDSKSPRRTELLQKIRKMFLKMADELPIDYAADQFAKKYQKDALPPYLTPAEQTMTYNGSEFETNEDGGVSFGAEVQLTSEVRLIKSNIARLVTEDNVIRLYNHIDNSKVYHEFESGFLEIEEEDAGLVETLIKEYPKFIAVSQLHEDSERAIALTQDLFDIGLLMKKTL
ncbi:bifunctional lysine-specific demethylase and histidyl-hydroxylase NO66 [Culicoides brevitarsis]|uniref:bifunctional lysine-specific demethylase and histidyl-hydroxylase NO66 n=1 Tax=Culicoides brevitarsis TaxID=469753 RepID=UPI00307C55E4